MYPPGRRFEYSNLGYKILGFILENVTGKLFEDLAAKMFEQLGLKNTFFVDAETILETAKKHPNLLISSLIVGGKAIDKSGKVRPPKCNPVGGLVTTATDLDKWNRLLHCGRIISKAGLEKMTTKAAEVDKRTDYGYGVFLKYRSENKLPEKYHEITHHGYAAAYKATLSYFPKTDVSLVILENISVNDFDKDFEMHTKMREIVGEYADF
jgi:CubicO group peptidase (beta-lactamase class C family)